MFFFRLYLLFDHLKLGILGPSASLQNNLVDWLWNHLWILTCLCETSFWGGWKGKIETGRNRNYS